MRRRSDYRFEMFSATVSEQEIERLLTGSPAGNGAALSDLATFVEQMRHYESFVPSDQLVDRVAAEAAALALTGRVTGVTGTKVSASSRRRWSALSPRLAVAALSVVMAIGMTGVAAAADSAAPGDPLYGLDRALERIGIGAGSAGERLEEADQLLTGGQTLQALEHAAEAVDGDAAASAALRIAIDRVGSVTDQGAASVREKVGDLLEFMSENIGKDKGVDGRDFGQGMAEIARGISSASESGAPMPANDPASGNQSLRDDDGPGNSDGQGDQGTGSGNSDPPGSGGNKGNENSGDGNNPGTGGKQGGGNRGAGGNGKGPPSDSPSVTAPGRGNRP